MLVTDGFGVMVIFLPITVNCAVMLVVVATALMTTFCVSDTL